MLLFRVFVEAVMDWYWVANKGREGAPTGRIPACERWVGSGFYGEWSGGEKFSRQTAETRRQNRRV